MRALTTARLELPPWRESFAGDLARLAADERVVRHVGDGRPWSAGHARERHQACLRHWEEHGFGWRAVLDGPGGPFIGVAALSYLGPLVPGIAESAIEIGWWLDPAAWGQGLATEAATAIRDEALGPLGAERVVARIQPANHASARVAARLGMRPHGDVTGRFGEPVRVYVLDRPG
jgi:RimJ/RimL family protein N-acetyltransferase